MRKAWVAVLLMASTLAAGKAWNGVEPGGTRREDLVKRFGDPSRTVQSDGKEVLAYFGSQAIKGTSQTQFRVDPKSQQVERIDVFPGPVIERETVEATYGPPCQTKTPKEAACYYRKLTEDFRTYLLYPRLGLAVFFNEDGKTVQSFIFQVPKAGAASGPK